jgi:hypothetical protein
LGGVTITVTDEEYDKISSELKSIAFSIQSCRSLDVMQIIYQVFQNLGITTYYRYERVIGLDDSVTVGKDGDGRGSTVVVSANGETVNSVI